ncbi:hypothetical protein DL546_007956 [Coniochaeta pulveracea]|uniref:Pre-mRNA-splicing factor SPF27 n=1 Tax=Coniochaeta pulveracea TaxID=177199 RepID=A0A420YCU7_9PEZI|nr:hypothetical protein DL546_007956 [Coniochaeta pulveracea]
MPSITTVHDSLPYIDPEPTASERAAAEALISQERSLVPDDPDHALLPPTINPHFSPAIEAELSRIASKQPLAAIDLTRYEAPDDTPAPSDLPTALERAYASATYLRARRAHLALLDSYGKNAWNRAQEEVSGDIKSLEETWKRGVGRVLETEVATETLRREVLEVRRKMA